MVLISEFFINILKKKKNYKKYPELKKISFRAPTAVDDSGTIELYYRCPRQRFNPFSFQIELRFVFYCINFRFSKIDRIPYNLNVLERQQ